MSTVDKMSAWILGIYADHALGAKVLQSIIDVLPEEFVQFRVSDLCSEVAYVTSHDGSSPFTWTIHLEEDVDISYESINTLEAVTVLKYPLSLIK